jgi:hypothetical protein
MTRGMSGGRQVGVLGLRGELVGFCGDLLALSARWKASIGVRLEQNQKADAIIISSQAHFDPGNDGRTVFGFVEV